MGLHRQLKEDQEGKEEHSEGVSRIVASRARLIATCYLRGHLETGLNVAGPARCQ